MPSAITAITVVYVRDVWLACARVVCLILTTTRGCAHVQTMPVTGLGPCRHSARLLGRSSVCGTWSLRVRSRCYRASPRCAAVLTHRCDRVPAPTDLSLSVLGGVCLASALQQCTSMKRLHVQCLPTNGTHTGVGQRACVWMCLSRRDPCCRCPEYSSPGQHAGRRRHQSRVERHGSIGDARDGVGATH